MRVYPTPSVLPHNHHAQLRSLLTAGGPALQLPHGAVGETVAPAQLIYRWDRHATRSATAMDLSSLLHPPQLTEWSRVARRPECTTSPRKCEFLSQCQV